MTEIHELKIWRRYFEAIKDGSKTFEVRRNDRNFAVGDLLDLREWNNGGDVCDYTGRRIMVRISYVMAGYTDRNGKPVSPLADGYVILGIKKEP